MTTPAGSITGADATTPLATALSGHYNSLHAVSEAIVHQSLAEPNGSRLALRHAVIGDLAKWLEVLKDRRESALLQSAAREYQFALYALSSGHYRQAFALLRLFFELTMAGLFYSAHQIFLLEWLAGKRDNNWRKITQSKTGIFTVRFARLFSCDELCEELSQYSALASKIYRECSEFVHGNIESSERLPHELAFSQDLFDAWQERAQTAWLVASYFLYMRYGRELTSAQRHIMELTILDQLGHLATVRADFSA